MYLNRSPPKGPVVPPAYQKSPAPLTEIFRKSSAQSEGRHNANTNNFSNFYPQFHQIQAKTIGFFLIQEMWMDQWYENTWVFIKQELQVNIEYLSPCKIFLLESLLQCILYYFNLNKLNSLVLILGIQIYINEYCSPKKCRFRDLFYLWKMMERFKQDLVSNFRFWYHSYHLSILVIIRN